MLERGTKVFIAGAPRTGTSILFYAVSTVFSLPGKGESHVMPAFSQMLHSFYTYLNTFLTLDRAVFSEILLANLTTAGMKQHLIKYVRGFYEEMFPDGSWVDKTPSPPGVYSLVMAASAFPAAKLIVTKRTGIEVVNSHVKKFGGDFASACDVWTSAMEGLSHITPLCKDLLIVDQFDFTNSTAEVAAALATHLGFPEKSAELSRFLLERQVEKSSNHDWKQRLRLDDTTWSPEQRQAFTNRCGPMMGAYGYEI
jgi:hypothetical protein